MAKKDKNIIVRIFTHNVGLKLLALIIAVVVWLYVSNEILKGVKI